MFSATIVFVLCFLLLSLTQGCKISLDCKDEEGRSLCYNQNCWKDVPCNKDNDCFFYGAADVSQNYPHPKCFKNPKALSKPGYGICMLKEYAENLRRIPGDDVLDEQTKRGSSSTFKLIDLLKKF